MLAGFRTQKSKTGSPQDEAVVAPLINETLKAWLVGDIHFAIAYSGGGDSTALLHALRDLSPHVFIVDHALRPESRKEALAAKSFAESVNLKTDVLTWQHDNPKTGLQEKARKARYALLGEACRRAGIAYLVTGHTQDDQAETLLMRYERKTDWRGAAGMRERAVSPIWPELAGVTVLRPALNITRQELRGYNKAHGLTWTEDPSNQNVDFTRIRARKSLVDRPGLRSLLLSTQTDLARGRMQEAKRLRQIPVDVDEHGIIHVQEQVPDKTLEYLLRAASGTGGPINAARVRALNNRMKVKTFKAFTYAGAMVVSTDNGAVILRDPVVARGRKDVPALAPQHWPAGQRCLWDGRFWIESDLDGVTVKPLHENQSLLSDKQRQSLQTVPAKARPTLPLIMRGNEVLAAGAATFHDSIHIKTAVRDHLNARLT